MNNQVTASNVVDALSGRVRVLLEAFDDTESEDISKLGGKVLELGNKVRKLQTQRRFRGTKRPVRLVPVQPRSRGELLATLHDLAVAIGDLEASLLRLPPTEPALRAFQNKIAVVPSVQLGNERYLEVHGHYDGTDARKSLWQVREINRQIARLERKRDRRWGWIGVIVAFALGVLSIGIAAMAIPTDHSFYCHFVDWFNLCSK